VDKGGQGVEVDTETLNDFVGLGFRAVLKLIVLCLVSFVLIGGTIRAVAPPNPSYPYHPTFTAKQRYLAETDDHITVAVVGNSRIVAGFDPVLFDDAFAAAGCSGRSYNAGTVNQSWYEYQSLVATLDGAPSGTPEVIVSADTALFDVGLGRSYEVRHRSHMKLGSMRNAIDYRLNLPPGEHPNNTMGAAALLAGIAVNQVPIGAASQYMFSQRPPDADEAADEADFVPNRQGFEGWDALRDEAGPEGLRNLRATIDDEIESGIWEARWVEQAPSDEIVAQWVATIEAHMAEVPEGTIAVHVLVPSFFDPGTAAAVTKAWNEEPRRGHLLNLLADDRIGDYTDPDYWIDRWHVNETGTGELSRATGQTVCALLREAQG